MVYNQYNIDKALRRAFMALSAGTGLKGDDDMGAAKRSIIKKSGFVKPANNISGPAFLQQELAFTTANRILRFDFGSNAPAPSDTLDNIQLGKNDIFACVGVRVRIGVGASANNRVYNSYGATADVEALYNAQLSMSFESRTPVTQIHTSLFKEKVQNGTDTFGTNGLVLIAPVRIFTGNIAQQRVEVAMPLLTGLTIPASTFIQVSLFGALARA